MSKSLHQAGAEDFLTNTCACAECGEKAEVNLDQLPGVVATCTGCGRHSDDSVGGGAAAIDMDHSPGGWTTAPHATVRSFGLRLRMIRVPNWFVWLRTGGHLRNAGLHDDRSGRGALADRRDGLALLWQRARILLAEGRHLDDGRIPR